MLDTDAGVQDFEIRRRIRNDGDWAARCGRRYRLSMRACRKLRFGRRIRLDKVLQRKRLAIALRSDGLLAGMLTTTVRGGVGSETEQKLRAGEAVTPEESA
jgi:hypothetical protein